MLARSARSLLARSSRFRSPPSALRSLRSFSALLRLPWLLSARPPCRRSASVSQFRSLRSFISTFHSENKSGIFEKKERSRRTHIFPENGIFGFCSASATQKHNSQKSTLHNTQLWCIFYPSAFGYGKCPITCVMYKPLRLWLRGSTFLLRRSAQSTAFAGVRLFSAWSLRPPAFPGVRPPLQRSARPPLQAFDLRFSRLRPTAFAGVRPPTGSATGRLTAPPPPPSAGSLWSALPPSAPWVVFCLRSAPTMSEKKIAKGFAFHNFFSDKTPLFQQIVLFLRCK